MSAPQPSRRRSVLVALDGSPAAATALPVARLVAAQLNAGLKVLHVAPTRVPTEVLRQRLHLDEAGLKDIEIHLHTGDPATGILQMVNDPDVALTVLTTHGRTIEPGRHLGRVAETVIKATTRPIMLVRPEAAARITELPPRLRCMLIPLDGTPTTATALGPAAALAQELGASIDMLYVAGADQGGIREPGAITPPAYVDQPQHEWPEWASEVMERLSACVSCPHDTPVRVFMTFGDIGEEIINFAIERQEHVIVLVRRSHLEPGRAKVLRALFEGAPCPLLLTGTTHTELATDTHNDARHHRTLQRGC